MSQGKTLDAARPARRAPLVIRQMTGPEELEHALDWAAAEGWNPGLHDAQCFYAADPDGFFLGLLDGEPIGCCFAVLYDDSYAFFGGYIVRPEFRGRGYGRQMTRARLAYIGHRNAGLDGVLSMQEKYARLGFRIAHRNLRYEGTAAGVPAQGVAPLREIPFDELVAYDTVHFSAPRIGFLRRWIDQPGGAALGAVYKGRLAGYGVVRPCRSGYKIGPLFADSDELAEALFESLSAKVSGSPVVLDTPDANPAAVALAERHAMTPVFETARMYLKGQPELPLRHIYGITTFELG